MERNADNVIANKPRLEESRASQEKAVKDGRQWAQSIFSEGDRTMKAFFARLASGGGG